MKLFKLILLFLLTANVARSQSLISAPSIESEVGIFEHLDSIIPLDLHFRNENNEMLH